MSPQHCESLIALAHAQGFQSTSVLGAAGVEYNAEVRSCDAAGLNPAQHREVYEFVADAVRHVNGAQYHFRITGLEPIQVLRYVEGSFFREHSDLGYQYDDSAGRKISLIAQLSPEDSYTGGGLVLFGEEEMPRSQGTVCLFPSWLPHRVDRLTSGVRYALVAWAKGPPFA
jgi:PKHD-type hydroxylase